MSIMRENASSSAGNKLLLFPPSSEEEDLLIRSSKKVRNDSGDPEEQWPRLGNKTRTFLEGGPSFLEKLKGTSREDTMEVQEDEDNLSDDSFSDKSLGKGKDEPICTTEEDPNRNFPTFSFSEGMKKKLYRAWKSAVIVKLLGRQIGYKTLVLRLQTMWAKKGILNVINIGHGFFVVKLSNREDFLHALTGGPWMIFDHYLTVQPWEPGFKSSKAEISKVAVWVRIPNIPMEYYDEEALTYIGNRIGKTLKVDMNTSCQLRGHFARICVLVELGSQLMPGFTLDGEEHFLEYEGLHLLCTRCGIYGHRQDSCPTRIHQQAKNEEPREVNNQNQQQNEEREHVQETEQWKIVEKRRYRRNRDKAGDLTTAGRTSTRFKVLEVGEQVSEAVIDVTHEQLQMNLSKKHGGETSNSPPTRSRFECNQKTSRLDGTRRGTEGTSGRERPSFSDKSQLRSNQRRVEKRTRESFKGTKACDKPVLLLTFGENDVGPSEKARNGKGKLELLKAQDDVMEAMVSVAHLPPGQCNVDLPIVGPQVPQQAGPPDPGDAMVLELDGARDGARDGLLDGPLTEDLDGCFLSPRGTFVPESQLS